MLGLPAGVTTCLFDLDGVLTDTASVHAAAWKEMFDAFLRARAERDGVAFVPFVPFDPEHDHETYVDGKPRLAGVRDFLTARGIALPEGTHADGPSAETVNGLGRPRARVSRVGYR
jgi:beta-phosphoglucomutase-like phosphatase (HAD superfamily)